MIPVGPASNISNHLKLPRKRSKRKNKNTSSPTSSSSGYISNIQTNSSASSKEDINNNNNSDGIRKIDTNYSSTSGTSLSDRSPSSSAPSTPVKSDRIIRRASTGLQNTIDDKYKNSKLNRDKSAPSLLRQKSTDRIEKRLREAGYKKDLIEGETLIKHGLNHRPHNRHVFVSEDLKYVMWGSSREKKLRTSELTAVHSKWPDDIANKLINRIKDGNLRTNSVFTLEFSERSLYLEATSSVKRDYWVARFIWLMEECSQKIVGKPFNVKHEAHVNINFEWSGDHLEDDFELLEKIGEGAFGEVYHCKHKASGFDLAVKIMPISKHSSNNLEKIQSEVEMLKKCKHNNIVSFFGSWPDKKGRLWIMMQLCSGGSLNDVLEWGNIDEKYEAILNEEQIAFIVQSVLKALVYLHSKDICHRDIKSGNLLLTSDGNVKLGDFGISRTIETETNENKVQKISLPVGSPPWMSPELVRGEGSLPAADIWALGITILELAEGEPPYGNLSAMKAMMAIESAKQPPTVTHKDIWSDNFLDFLQQCLQIDPKKRPTASELLIHPYVARPLESAVLRRYATGKPKVMRLKKSRSIFQRMSTKLKGLSINERNMLTRSEMIRERRKRQKEDEQKQANNSAIQTTQLIQNDRRDSMPSLIQPNTVNADFQLVAKIMKQEREQYRVTRGGMDTSSSLERGSLAKRTTSSWNKSSPEDTLSSWNEISGRARTGADDANSLEAIMQFKGANANDSLQVAHKRMRKPSQTKETLPEIHRYNNNNEDDIRSISPDDDIDSFDMNVPSFRIGGRYRDPQNPHMDGVRLVKATDSLQLQRHRLYGQELISPKNNKVISPRSQLKNSSVPINLLNSIKIGKDGFNFKEWIIQLSLSEHDQLAFCIGLQGESPTRKDMEELSLYTLGIIGIPPLTANRILYATKEFFQQSQSLYKNDILEDAIRAYGRFSIAGRSPYDKQHAYGRDDDSIFENNNNEQSYCIIS